MMELTDTEKEECQKAINAVVDYNMAEICKKMVLHGVDFELAFDMQMAVIAASA